MYYHVFIETSSTFTAFNGEDMLYEVDIISKEDLLNDIIIPYINKDSILIQGYRVSSFQDIKRITIKSTEKPLIYDSSIYRYKDIRNYPETILERSGAKDITREILKEAKKRNDEEVKKYSEDFCENTENMIDKTKVFIVHGHDDLAKTKVARFIEKIGFEAIILHEQASKGKTIIEKIEDNTNVGFAIILYTPCDVGGKEGNLKARARQNVVFEHGFLMAKIGRNNVCALVKDSVETPNDISGVVYIAMDSEGAWEFKIAKEMKESGYDIDSNKIL